MINDDDFVFHQLKMMCDYDKNDDDDYYYYLILKIATTKKMEFLKLIIKKIYQHIHNVVITVELLNMGLVVVVVSLLLLLLLLINSKFILSCK
jgi:hypothetical protein